MVQAEGRVFDFLSTDTIDPEILETFPYEYPEREAMVEIETDEWSCVCPFSGLPDYGVLRIRYVPSDVCIELKSLKYYLVSYRQVGIYQEHAANRLLEDLLQCCRPHWMEVFLDYRLRGGIHTIVRVEHGIRKIAAESSPSPH